LPKAKRSSDFGHVFLFSQISKSHISHLISSLSKLLIWGLFADKKGGLKYKPN
jgi:hypothetical protein